MSKKDQLPIEPPFLDKKGNQIKEFDLIKIFHFKGRNSRGNGQKNYYLYKWVRIEEIAGKRFYVGYHLNDDNSNFFRLAAIGGASYSELGCRILHNVEILND